MKDFKKFGKSGEEIAAQYLVDNGFSIVEKNYEYRKGEIDLIVRKDDLLIFVEVKSRRNLEFGPPELSITESKQRQIKKIAKAYLFEKRITDQDCRIDVIAITFSEDGSYHLNHIENAF